MRLPDAASGVTRNRPCGSIVRRRPQPKSRAYILMAAYEGDHWTFNPSDDSQVGAGVALVLMTDPDGRAFAEEQIRKHS